MNADFSPKSDSKKSQNASLVDENETSESKKYLNKKKENLQSLDGDGFHTSETYVINSSEFDEDVSSGVETENDCNDDVDCGKENDEPNKKQFRSGFNKRRSPQQNRGFYGNSRGNSKKNANGSPKGENGWGNRSNLVDKNGFTQRVTSKLTNYIAIYRAKYFYYFDLVNGRYPHFVRKYDNGMEIWRMCFNIYVSGLTGFTNLVAHIGEVHAFYQMEMVDNQLKWVYKDFNFYPNKMRFGFRVSSYDVADIYSRFIKFACIKDNLMKNFPNVNIHHKNFIKHKFEENLQAMKNRLDEVFMEKMNTNNTAPVQQQQSQPKQQQQQQWSVDGVGSAKITGQKDSYAFNWNDRVPSKGQLSNNIIRRNDFKKRGRANNYSHY